MLRYGFIAWGTFVFTYLFMGYRTIEVPPEQLANSDAARVVESNTALALLPNQFDNGLVFFCGSGVSAVAYVPLLRPIAERGTAVFIVKLPFRFAMLESHKTEAIDRALDTFNAYPDTEHWIVGGHSLGGALASRMAHNHADKLSGLILVGTTHPKVDDLSGLTFPVMKVYGALDGIAPLHKIQKNKPLLPEQTIYAQIDGGNHSQFANYAWQLLDGTPSISRVEQQSKVRERIFTFLKKYKP